MRLTRFVAFLGCFAWSVVAHAQTTPPTLIIISVDGMRADYITQAEAHGAKVPNMRRFLSEGSYADGVEGVVPTITYPSHTTIVTGVAPARHGILANAVFDPLHKNADGWYWYAEDIRVPTLWDVAGKAGRTTASVHWPVTVGAAITWNIPEVWHADGEQPDDFKLLRALSTPGLMAQASPDVGLYPGALETPESDSIRGRYGEWLLEHKHPGVLLVHLISLDGTEHETGPFSPQALAVLERLDAAVGRLRATAERATSGHAIVAVVSDHGFTPYHAQLNLFSAFRAAGLFTTDTYNKVTDWKAMPWNLGGSVAIVVKDTTDTATITRVRELLHHLAADSAAGIDRVFETAELHQHEALSTAAFWVGLKPGWRSGSSMDGPVTSPITPGGTHGGYPDLPELHAAFMVIGPGVPAGKDLGTIDMRDVAPTLARLVGLAIPSAEGKALLSP